MISDIRMAKLPVGVGGGLPEGFSDNMISSMQYFIASVTFNNTELRFFAIGERLTLPSNPENFHGYLGHPDNILSTFLRYSFSQSAQIYAGVAIRMLGP